MNTARTIMIAGNWKMNLGHDDARALARDIAAASLTEGHVEVAVFPPYPWLVPVHEALVGSMVRLGAQNCHSAPSGAFTGEVSAGMLQGLCNYVIIGHSERRHIFGESDQTIAEKALTVVSAGLGLVLCVGETLEERERGDAGNVVSRQLQTAFDVLANDSSADVTVAYEPVWAIGTGVAATADDAQLMCTLIRKWLRAHVSDDVADRTRVLYGGSVTPANAQDLLSQTDIDGALVGGASLKSHDFLGIVEAAHTVVAP